MTEQLARLRDAIRRPLPLGYHPLYRFYRGGSSAPYSSAFTMKPASTSNVAEVT